MSNALIDTAPDFSQPIAVLKHCHDRIRKQLLTPPSEGSKLGLYIVEMEPGASTGDELYTHGGEEAGLVMSGAMALRVESESWTLQEGDSFRFLSSRPHRFANAAEGETRVLWVACL